MRRPRQHPATLGALLPLAFPASASAPSVTVPCTSSCYPDPRRILTGFLPRTWMQNDFWMFFRSWLAAPLRVAAVAPSGSALARIMTQDITSSTGPVIELGPGTGVFTAKLLERGVRPEDLTLVEYGANFARHLETRFPRARVLRMDAARLGISNSAMTHPSGRSSVACRC